MFAGAACLVATIPGQAGAGPNPPGNNGTVKIDGVEFDDHPNNEPHVGCIFQVDWYGFDEGDLNSQVTFQAWPPTGSGEVLLEDTVFIGEDDNSGGGSEAGLDASRTYDLTDALQAFTPHPEQGWHVKLTIHADGSQGADTKHKVFWVSGCETPPTTTSTTEAPTTSTTEEETTSTTEEETTSTSVEETTSTSVEETTSTTEEETTSTSVEETTSTTEKPTTSTTEEETTSTTEEETTSTTEEETTSTTEEETTSTTEGSTTSSTEGTTTTVAPSSTSTSMATPPGELPKTGGGSQGLLIAAGIIMLLGGGALLGSAKLSTKPIA
jgi:LPXTG-motif cell wall-anchored protein